MEISQNLKIIMIFIYFILIISIERFYCQVLFNKSLEIIPKFQKSSKSFHLFWNFITFFGTKPGIGPIYLILFLFIPLNKVYVLTNLILFTGFVDHTLKVVYLQERPIWMNDDIDIGNLHACGYGNPSGHSLSSTCLYLSFWYIISELINKNAINECTKKLLNYLILIFCILIFGLIMTSRLYLGVHSLNQIIFGCSLGLGIFLLFMPVLKIYKSSGLEFLNKQYSNRYKDSFLIMVCIISFYIFYFSRNDIEGVKEKPNWIKMCNDQKWSKLLIKGSFMGGMSMFIILGMNLGLLSSKAKIDKQFNSKDEIIINWTEETFISRLIRLFLLLVGFCPVGIIFLLNTFFDISFIFYYILTPILFFIGGFLTFGPCFFYGFKITLNKFGNNEIISLSNDNSNSSQNVVDFSNEIYN